MPRLPTSLSPPPLTDSHQGYEGIYSSFLLLVVFLTPPTDLDQSRNIRTQSVIPTRFSDVNQVEILPCKRHISTREDQKPGRTDEDWMCVMEPTCCGVSSQVSVIKRTRTLELLASAAIPVIGLSLPARLSAPGRSHRSLAPLLSSTGARRRDKSTGWSSRDSEDATVWPAPRLPRSSERSRWLVCWNIQRS